VVIRGAIYRVDLGEAKRGREQRARRLARVLSPTSMPWSLATIVPTSTTAQQAVIRYLGV
jgi:mRNA interferase MazF